MINPVYILSKEDYEALVNILMSMTDYIDEVPDGRARMLIENGAKTALFILGKDM